LSTLRRTIFGHFAKLCHSNGGDLRKSNFSWVTRLF